jgi:hypothetical protein
MCEVFKVGEWIGWCDVYVHTVSNHYMHLMERKFNGFVVNKTIENIVQKNLEIKGC